MNKTIKLLMLSDIFVMTGFGLTDPILAIFVKENLVGGTIFAAGLASTFFLVTKCLVQLPFSKYVDTHSDKVKWLIAGTFLITAVPFLYIFANHINIVYLAQVIHGWGAGMAYPVWLSMWSTHLDKKQESFEWSLYSTFAGIGVAITAAAGAAIAELAGFAYSFVLTGSLSLVGCIVLFWLEKKHAKPPHKHVVQYHYHRHRKIWGKRHR